MINFFKKINPKEISLEKVKRPMNEIIAEIHDTFYTEVDRLLADAKILRSIKTDKQDLIDKCNRLKALGFTQTQEIIEAEKEIERLGKIQLENDANNSLAKAIEYFSVKYPNYKFITKKSVEKICEKYGLIYGEISKYKGTVPTKNMEHIENFKINEEDEAYLSVTSYTILSSKLEEKIVGFLDYKNFIVKRQDIENIQLLMRLRIMENIHKCPLEIAAPKKNFDLTGSKMVGLKLTNIPEIPDPVVLKPVYFEGKKHYLIVTAWGLEASDELVVNQKMN